MAWLEEAVRRPLGDIGFRKRSGGIFTADVAEDTLGWLGLNRASEHQPKGRFEVNPVIGVRLQRIEREVSRLQARPFHSYLPPTASRPLGYLMPQARYKAWFFEAPDGPPEIAQDMADAIRVYGFPFIKSNALPEAIVNAFPSRLKPPDVYRVAVALAILGRAAEATSLLHEAVRGLAAREDAAAKALRQFADAFEAAPPAH